MADLFYPDKAAIQLNDNMFIFGLNTAEVAELQGKGYNPWDYCHGNGELRQVLEMIDSGFFSPGEHDRFLPIMTRLP